MKDRAGPSGKQDGNLRAKSDGASLISDDASFQYLLEAVPDSTVIVDESGAIQYANGAAETLFGYSRSELLGQTIDMLVPDHLKEAHVGHRARFSQSPHRRSMGAGLELYAKRKDGRLIPVDIGLSPLKIRDKTLTIAAIRDLTEHKEAEQEIHKLNAELSQFFRLSQDLMAIAGTDGYFKRINPSWEKALGYRGDELLVKPYIEFVHPDDREQTTSEADKLAGGDYATFSFENRYRHKDGSYRWIQWNSAVADDRIFAVARDVTQQKKLEAEYRQAKIDAEQANQAKSEFLSRMSHELRTPLNAVLGFAQLMQLDDLTVQQRENTEQIIKGGKHLLQLINEVLDIARIEGGRMQLSPEPISAREAIDEARVLMKPLAEQRRMWFEMEATPAWHQYVFADKQRLKQVFLNLISNAIKYGHEGDKVTLRCEARSNRMLRFSVVDTGPGIPHDKLEGLFTPFTRLETNEPGIEGTGLGLVLSKRLIEAMNGRLDVESVAGSGSTFWIELPVTESPLHRDKLLEESAHASAHHVRAGQKVRTVLYIEDNLSNLKLIEQILSRRPEVKLLSVMQGRLGMQMAKEHRPDLILLDLHLPDISGDEILRQLQSDLDTSGIPVIMISADATPNQIRRLQAAGADGYLTKPLDVKKFLTLLDQVLYEEG